MVFEMALSAENGAIRFKSGRQFLFIAGLKIPGPKLVRGNIDLIEWYDDEQQKFYLDLKLIVSYLVLYLVSRVGLMLIILILQEKRFLINLNRQGRSKKNK
jgi:hypothetical protein